MHASAQLVDLDLPAGAVLALTLARAQGLEAGLVPEGELATLDDKRETGVDVLLGLLLLESKTQKTGRKSFTHDCEETVYPSAKRQ